MCVVQVNFEWLKPPALEGILKSFSLVVPPSIPNKALKQKIILYLQQEMNAKQVEDVHRSLVVENLSLLAGMKPIPASKTLEESNPSLRVIKLMAKMYYSENGSAAVLPTFPLTVPVNDHKENEVPHLKNDKLDTFWLKLENLMREELAEILNEKEQKNLFFQFKHDLNEIQQNRKE
jgi:hypothetical protein